MGVVPGSVCWVDLRRRNGLSTVTSLLDSDEPSRKGRSSCTCAGGGVSIQWDVFAVF